MKHLQQVVDTVRFTAFKLASIQKTVFWAEVYVG